MKAISKPKFSILFPNQWAVDSFLRKLKSAAGWDYKASMDGRFVKLTPKGGDEYILIGLNRGRGVFNIEFNGEKLPRTAEEIWKEILEYAARYRC